MKNKSFAGLVTGLFVFGLGGIASAAPFNTDTVSTAPDSFIEGSTTYVFEFDGLPSPTQFEGGALFIQETNADFNNASDTVSVKIDGVQFGGGHYFADDNANIERTLMIPIPLGFTDLFYISDDGEAVVELTTSQSVRSGTILSTLHGTLTVWLSYDGIVEQPPGDLMADLIAFFEDGVAAGTIVGVGPGNSASSHLKAFGKMLDSADDLIAEGDTTGACEQLQDAAKRADGTEPPPDFIGGVDASVVYTMLLEVMSALGCEAAIM